MTDAADGHMTSMNSSRSVKIFGANIIQGKI